MKISDRVYIHPSLRIPRTHPWLFASLYLPAIASIIAGAIIYRFSWLSLILPGVWCFAVACFLVDALISGTITDNHGTAIRERSPIRYWLKVAFWSLGYLFALVFPVAYALQETGRSHQSQLPPPSSHEQRQPAKS